MNVYLIPGIRYGKKHNEYIVYVDNKIYDRFVSTRWLTFSEMDDVASYYLEGLTGDYMVHE